MARAEVWTKTEQLDDNTLNVATVTLDVELSCFVIDRPTAERILREAGYAPEEVIDV